MSRLLLLFCLIQFLSGCTDNNFRDNGSEKTVATSAPKDEISGVWYYNFPFYSSSLELRKDSTFRYESQGCTHRHSSEGKWELQLNTIILNSFDRFQPSGTKLVMHRNTPSKKETGKEPEDLADTTPGLSLSVPENNISDFTGISYTLDLSADTVLFFKQEKFKLEKGFLYQLTAQKEEIKYSKNPEQFYIDKQTGAW